MKREKKKLKPITDYDEFDTSEMIDPSKPLKLQDLGLKLPKSPPTQVISIRLPTHLLNKIRAIGSQRDVPYQALIKLFLAQSVERLKEKLA
ncbi:MAG TPA: CopG family antitoxin [Bdellovibrionota bacterium]|nr:CopG family antitoxin [Bdellovibrionota bacterium]